MRKAQQPFLGNCSTGRVTATGSGSLGVLLGEWTICAPGQFGAKQHIRQAAVEFLRNRQCYAILMAPSLLARYFPGLRQLIQRRERHAQVLRRLLDRHHFRMSVCHVLPRCPLCSAESLLKCCIFNAGPLSNQECSSLFPPKGCLPRSKNPNRFPKGFIWILPGRARVDQPEGASLRCEWR